MEEQAMADVKPERQPADNEPKPLYDGPSPIDEDEILNWDFYIENPPIREQGTIRVKLVYAGPAKPIPVESPWADEPYDDEVFVEAPPRRNARMVKMNFVKGEYRAPKLADDLEN
jgi:hypothetical protein